MPRRNKDRKSDDPVWATFKIPYDKWQHFKAVAKAEGNTASATLVDLIEGYLTSESKSEVEEITTSDHKSLAEALKQTFLDLDHKIAGSQAIFSDHDDHLSEILNQKISILEQSLTERLEKILTDRLRKIVSQSFSSLDQELNQELKGFLDKIDQLEKQLQSLQKQVGNPKLDLENSQYYTSSSVNYSVNVSKNTKLIDIEAIAIEKFAVQESKDDMGLTQQLLCEQFGINSTQVARNADLRNLSTPEYLYQVTGWVYQNGKYYPPQF